TAGPDRAPRRWAGAVRRRRDAQEARVDASCGSDRPRGAGIARAGAADEGALALRLRARRHAGAAEETRRGQGSQAGSGRGTQEARPRERSSSAPGGPEAVAYGRARGGKGPERAAKSGGTAAEPRTFE